MCSIMTVAEIQLAKEPDDGDSPGPMRMKTSTAAHLRKIIKCIRTELKSALRPVGLPT